MAILINTTIKVIFRIQSRNLYLFTDKALQQEEAILHLELILAITWQAHDGNQS